MVPHTWLFVEHIRPAKPSILTDFPCAILGTVLSLLCTGKDFEKCTIAPKTIKIFEVFCIIFLSLRNFVRFCSDTLTPHLSAVELYRQIYFSRSAKSIQLLY